MRTLRLLCPLLLFFSCTFLSTPCFAGNVDAAFYEKFTDLYSPEAFQNYHAEFIRIVLDPRDSSNEIQKHYDVRVNGSNYIGTSVYTFSKPRQGEVPETRNSFSSNGELAISCAETADTSALYILTPKPSLFDPILLPQALGVTSRPSYQPISLDGKVLSLGLGSEVLQKITFDDMDACVFSEIEALREGSVTTRYAFREWMDFSGRRLPRSIAIHGSGDPKQTQTLTLLKFEANPDPGNEDYVLAIQSDDRSFIQDSFLDPPLLVQVQKLNQTLVRDKNYRQATKQYYLMRNLDPVADVAKTLETPPLKSSNTGNPARPTSSTAQFNKGAQGSTARPAAAVEDETPSLASHHALYIGVCIGMFVVLLTAGAIWQVKGRGRGGR